MSTRTASSPRRHSARSRGAPAQRSEMEILLRRVERERQARKQAEHLLEHKSAELYESNQRLQAQAAELELTVQERTRALEEATGRDAGSAARQERVPGGGQPRDPHAR